MNINLSNIWETQARQISDDIILRHKISQLKRLDCYIGTICSLGKKLFIMKLKSDDHSCNFQNRFAGVDIYISQNKNNKELYILLQDEKLSDIFIYFIEDVIHSLTDIYDNITALKIIKERVNFWRLLFSKISRDILSAEQQRGLFGELYFLEKLLDETNDKHVVINAWHGPLALNQDFRFNNFAIEIKATKKNNPTIRISNEYQLDRSGLDDLYLYFIQLNEYPGQNNTLSQIINKIKSKLDDECITLFNERLELIGLYSDYEITDYNSTSYSINLETMYTIIEGFPCITKKNLDNALLNVSYDIDERLCVDYKVEICKVIEKIINI